MKKLFLIAAILIGSIAIVNAGGDNKLIFGESVRLKSNILNEERTVLISLPQNYGNTTNNYPILFLLDGSVHFKHGTGVTDFLSKQGLAPETIVVAIINVNRRRDFTPITVEGATTGGAEKFHNFLQSELLPYIEDNYRVSGYKILMGHSLGGLFAAYSLLNHPGFFDSFIAVSPHLQYADNYIVKQSKKKLQRKYDKPISFFMTIGEGPEYFEPLDKFSSLMEKKSGNSINFLYVQMHGENHSTTPYFSLFNGLRFTFSDWVIPRETYTQGLAAIDQHFAQLSKKYNYEITTSESTINVLGYDFLLSGEVEEAIEIFKENVSRFPNSANVYDSLGEAYENNNQLKLARDNYKKAYKLGVEQNLRTASIFKTNLERVSK